MIFRAIIAIFALFAAAFGAKITNYNFTSSAKNFDLTLSFNEPFVYGIKEQKSDGKSIIILENTSIKDAVFETAQSKFLTNIAVFNIKNNALQIEFSSKAPLQISAAKTADKQSMRIRVEPKIVKNFSELGAQKSNKMDGKYIAVIVVLLLLCAGLFALRYMIEKKKINLNTLFKNMKKPRNSSKNSSLKSTNSAPKSEVNTEQKTEPKLEFSQIAANFGIKTNEDLKTIFEKNLDENNKVVLLEHENRRYLVLVGRSNILLDRFGEDIIETRSDFERFFEANKDRLGSFISKRQSSLENYEKKLTEDKE